jgi:ferredoxin
LDPATAASIRRLWIEEGCISCSLCSDYAPAVFSVENGEPCVIRPDAAAQFAALDEEIRDAARDCPVEVIRFEESR